MIEKLRKLLDLIHQSPNDKVELELDRVLAESMVQHYIYFLRELEEKGKCPKT